MHLINFAMKNIIISILVFVMLATSCKKPPTYYINSDMKAAFNFPVGSYWVYKDSLSGQIDSFYVAKNDPSFIHYSDHSVERLDLYISECSTNNNWQDSSQWYFQMSSDFISLRIVKYSLQKPNGYPLYEEWLIQYPFKLGIIPNTIIGTLTNIFPSYTVNGVSFSNVAEVDDSIYNGVSTNSFHDWYYLCPNVGFVKMRLDYPTDSINRIWELQHYYIKK